MANGKTMTTAAGYPVADKQNSMSAGALKGVSRDIQIRMMSHFYKANSAYGKSMAQTSALRRSR